MKFLVIFALITYNWLFIKAISDNDINLTPKNGEYCTGGNITMNCTITGALEDELFPANDLIFKYNGELVESSMVEVINATTAQYLITDKVPDKNNFHVECCYKNCPASKSYTNSVAVKSFVQPVEVQNLTCIIEGVFFGPVRCTWDYGIDYTKSWNKPDVYFIWRSSGSSKWNSEKLDSVANNSKYFSASTLYSKSEVGVNITSSHCASKAVYMSYSSIKTVQLPAVTNLTAVPLTNRCSEISWKKEIIDGTFQKSCSIHCTNKWNLPTNKVFNICQTSVKLCEMIPNTTYTCTVKVKVNRPTAPHISWSAEIWSEGRSTTVHTLDDVPDKSPAVTDGAFMWEDKDCSSKHTIAPVWIYWKPIEPRYHNGRLNGTLLTYAMDTEGNGTIANVSAHAARLLLDCEQIQTVVLQSVNNIGLSIASSQLQISPFNQDMIELIVEEDQLNSTVMFLEWDNSERKQVNTFTVFYAAKNGVTCSSESLDIVKWKNISGVENKTKITISKRPHCYGLSAQTANGSSGFRWTDCVYAKNAVPKPPEEVNVTDRGGNSLVVRWSKTPCSTSQPYIKWFQVKYCPVTVNKTCGPDEIISCSHSSSSLILDHLVTGTNYNISVRAVTRFNVTGNWSTTISASPTNRSTRLETEKVENTIVIVLTVVIIAILLVLIVVTYTRRKWNKYVASSTGVENIPVSPGTALVAKGNTDIPSNFSNGKKTCLGANRYTRTKDNFGFSADNDQRIPSSSSIGENTYIGVNGYTRTKDNLGFLANNDHRPTSGDEEGENMNSYSTSVGYDYSEARLMLTGSRQTPNGAVSSSIATGVNTYETACADADVTKDTSKLDSELVEHSTSDMYSNIVTVTRAEHDPSKGDHNKLDENAPDTCIEVNELATADRNLAQRGHKLDEIKHALNSTDKDKIEGYIEHGMLTEITAEAGTAEKICDAYVKTAPAKLNTAEHGQAEPSRFESVALQSNVDVKYSMAENMLLVKNANEQFSKLSDKTEMGTKTDFSSIPDDSETETKHAQDHKNNGHIGYVTADHIALKEDQHLKSTAETESKALENKSKEMGDTAKSNPEKMSESVVSVNKTGDKESNSNTAETKSKEMENISKEMEDTAEFHPEKLSESVSVNETDDEENESLSVEEYMTSEQISNIIMNDIPRNHINSSSYQQRDDGYVVHA